ncbi:DUF397 domain-containing protein [Streptomyces turgidiscabies]|uniref:DUF397 domain-containing protein n=1 Tax=Streptomyces turgidiscabies TaxID=85558 RepID=UPI0038F6FF7C
MDSTTGSTTPDPLADAQWFKASASGGSGGGCLEVAFLNDGTVAVRDNEDLSNPPFVVSQHVWTCFLDGAGKGEFDLPA